MWGATGVFLNARPTCIALFQLPGLGVSSSSSSLKKCQLVRAKYLPAAEKFWKAAFRGRSRGGAHLHWLCRLYPEDWKCCVSLGPHSHGRPSCAQPAHATPKLRRHWNSVRDSLAKPSGHRNSQGRQVSESGVSVCSAPFESTSFMILFNVSILIWILRT